MGGLGLGCLDAWAEIPSGVICWLETHGHGASAGASSPGLMVGAFAMVGVGLKVW